MGKMAWETKATISKHVKNCKVFETSFKIQDKIARCFVYIKEWHGQARNGATTSDHIVIHELGKKLKKEFNARKSTTIFMQKKSNIFSIYLK